MLTTELNARVKTLIRYAHAIDKTSGGVWNTLVECTSFEDVETLVSEYKKQAKSLNLTSLDVMLNKYKSAIKSAHVLGIVFTGVGKSALEKLVNEEKQKRADKALADKLAAHDEQAAATKEPEPVEQPTEPVKAVEKENSPRSLAMATAIILNKLDLQDLKILAAACQAELNAREVAAAKATAVAKKATKKPA